MNNTEDPFLEDMNWINRTCKKSKKSMSEIEINEDNCVFDEFELLFGCYAELLTEKTDIDNKIVKARNGAILKKIRRLNDILLAKEQNK